MSTMPKLPKLDFLRAISAALVILYHYGYVAVPGSFGVLVFFVVSGFLITYLLLRESARTGTVDLGKFYARRSLRIFPALYVYWLVAVAVMTARHSRILWGQAICALLYVNNYYQGLHGYPSTPFSHTWSLGVEEQFYLVWPVVFMACRRSLGWLTRGLLAAIPCLWVYRAVLQWNGVADAYIYTSFETRIDAILVGCLLAVVLATRGEAAWVREVRRTRYVPLTLAVLGTSLFGGSAHLPGYRNVVGFALDPLLVALLIAQLVATSAWRWMDAPPISYLGRISYSTYLYQQLVLPFLGRRLPPSLALAGCFAGVWIVAAISYEVVEQPFLRLKSRFETMRPRERVKS